MPYRPVEAAKGQGSLWKEGTKIGDASYHLTVVQDSHVTKTIDQQMHETPGLLKVEGTILPVDKALPGRLLGQPLTLLLTDGRRFDFFFRNDHGSIAASGGGGFYLLD